MFKSTPIQLKFLEQSFNKSFPTKSFSNLVEHSRDKAKLIFKDKTDNTYYIIRSLNPVWKVISDPDIIEKL